MKKGVWGPGILIIGLIVILALFGYYISTSFGEYASRRRYLFEATLISESDRVETYVRSFERAIDLSLIQSIYSAGSGHVILEEDFDSIYSNNTRTPYWQIYDSVYIPQDLDVFKEKIGNLTLRISTSFITDYFGAIVDFINAQDPETVFIGNTNVTVYSFGLDRIEIYGDLNNPLILSKTVKVENQEIQIDRSIPIVAEIKTKFVKMLNKSHDVVVNKKLEGCVLNATGINEDELKEDAQECLTDLAIILGEEDIKVNFTILSKIGDRDGFKYESGEEKRYAVINASFLENSSINYTVYDYLLCENPVSIKNFLINFMVRVGNLTEYDPDQIVVRSIEDTAEYPSKFWDCGNGLGAISCNDICNFLPGVPIEMKGCYEDEIQGPKNPLPPFEGIKPENPGKTFGPLSPPPSIDWCEFSLKTSENNITEYYCLGQAGSVEGETKYNCTKYCEGVYGDGYTSYCLDTCSNNGSFCFCNDCELNSITVMDDCFYGGSPYCEHGYGDKLDIEAFYSGKDCLSGTFNIQIDSWNNTNGDQDSCLICDFDYREEKPTCGPDCDIEGITVECNNPSCQASWAIPEIPLKCWDKSISLNTSFLTSADGNHYQPDGLPTSTPLLYGYYLTDANFEFASCVDMDRNPSYDIKGGDCVCVSIAGSSCTDIGWNSCGTCDLTGNCIYEGGRNKICCSPPVEGRVYGDSPTKGGNTTNRTGDPSTGYLLDVKVDYCSQDGSLLYEYYCEEGLLKNKTYDCSEFCRPTGCPPDRVFGECWNWITGDTGGWDSTSGEPAWCQCICQPGNDIVCHSNYFDGDYVSNGCDQLCADETCRWSGHGIDCMCAYSQVCYEKICKLVSADLKSTPPSETYAWLDTMSIQYKVKNTGDIAWTFLDEIEIQRSNGSYVIVDGDYPQSWDNLDAGKSKIGTLSYDIGCSEPLGTWTYDLYSYTDQSTYLGWRVSTALTSTFELVQCNDATDCHICLGDTNYDCDEEIGDCCYPKELETPLLSSSTLNCGEPFVITCPSVDCPDCLNASTGGDGSCIKNVGTCDVEFNCIAPSTGGTYQATCTANRGGIEDCCQEDVSVTYTITGEPENFNTDNSCSDGFDNDCDTDVDGDDHECQCRHPCTVDADCYGPDEYCDSTNGTQPNSLSKCHTCTIDNRQNSCKAFDELVEVGLGIGDCELACGADLVCDEKSQSYSWCENNKRYDCSGGIGCQQNEIEDCGDKVCWDDNQGTTQCVELCPPAEESCWIECTPALEGITLGGCLCKGGQWLNC